MCHQDWITRPHRQICGPTSSTLALHVVSGLPGPLTDLRCCSLVLLCTAKVWLLLQTHSLLPVVAGCQDLKSRFSFGCLSCSSMHWRIPGGGVVIAGAAVGAAQWRQVPFT